MLVLDRMQVLKHLITRWWNEPAAFWENVREKGTYSFCIQLQCYGSPSEQIPHKQKLCEMYWD